jgi:hypothetical protein
MLSLWRAIHQRVNTPQHTSSIQIRGGTISGPTPFLRPLFLTVHPAAFSSRSTCVEYIYLRTRRMRCPERSVSKESSKKCKCHYPHTSVIMRKPRSISCRGTTPGVSRVNIARESSSLGGSKKPASGGQHECMIRVTQPIHAVRAPHSVRRLTAS